MKGDRGSRKGKKIIITIVVVIVNIILVISLLASQPSLVVFNRHLERVFCCVSEKSVQICFVIVTSKLLKRHSIAQRRAPAYSRALRQIRGVFPKDSPWENQVRLPESERRQIRR